MPLKDLSLAKVYQLLEPGPVVLPTTARKGRANIMTMSWHMMVEFEPPLIACVVSSADYSFATLRATKECVIAIPALKLAQKVVKVGNCSGEDVDKFAKFALTPLKAKRIKAPLVAESFANLECKVVDMRLVDSYNLFILEVLKAWIDPKQGKPKTLDHHGYGKFVNLLKEFHSILFIKFAYKSYAERWCKHQQDLHLRQSWKWNFYISIFSFHETNFLRGPSRCC